LEILCCFSKGNERRATFDEGIRTLTAEAATSTREVGHAYATLRRSGRGFRFIARPFFCFSVILSTAKDLITEKRFAVILS
jgi:hypothetical protein